MISHVRLTALFCGSPATGESSGGSGLSITDTVIDVGASTNTVLVTVQDGTKSKDREVTASITVSVIDKPEPPLLVRRLRR